MKYLTVVAAAALVCALIAPASFAQPSGDVPTNHWAYDAIARLMAKGIIEGYPDKTFKGDRAMTRYEMAMVVARLLARIESIHVPAAPAAPAPTTAPAAPAITRVDVETIQRLVSEFRAELAALGVRTTAIEEELNALKARAGYVRVGGNFRFRGEEQRGPGPAATAAATSVNGNGRVSPTDSSSLRTFSQDREVFKLNFDGSVTPDLHLIAALVTCPTGLTLFPCLNYVNFNSSVNVTLANVDSLFFDWKNAFGWPLEFWLGRWGCTPGESFRLSAPQVGACYATQFGPFGLLMNSTGGTWEDTTGNSGNNFADGLMAKLSWPSLFDLKVQAAVIRLNAAGTGGFGSSDMNVYGLDMNGQVFAGMRVGANYVTNILYAGGPPGLPIPTTILYGPGGGSLGAPGSRCTPNVNIGTSFSGFTCDAAGNGYGAYVQYDVAPGIHFDGEWATWTDTGPTPGSDTGYQVDVHWDLGALTGLGHNFSLDTGYLNFGQNFYPPAGAAEADIAMNDNLYPGNTNGWLANLSFDIAQAWTLYGILFTGNTTSNGQALSQYEAGIVYRFAPSAKITLKVRDEKVANIDQFMFYRAQMDYDF